MVHRRSQYSKRVKNIDSREKKQPSKNNKDSPASTLNKSANKINSRKKENSNKKQNEKTLKTADPTKQLEENKESTTTKLDKFDKENEKQPEKSNISSREVSHSNVECVNDSKQKDQNIQEIDNEKYSEGNENKELNDNKETIKEPVIEKEMLDKKDDNKDNDNEKKDIILKDQEETNKEVTLEENEAKADNTNVDKNQANCDEVQTNNRDIGTKLYDEDGLCDGESELLKKRNSAEAEGKEFDELNDDIQNKKVKSCD